MAEALEVRRTFAAAPERVFAAWTTPEELKLWAGPGPIECPVTEVDLRVGGRFRINMRDPNGKEYRVVGTYREVDPPRRLVYTWSWETDPLVTDSLVTVDFHDRSGKTEVVLRHEKFPDAERRDRHQVGWTACLEKLAAML
jgi:glutathione S-transferase